MAFVDDLSACAFKRRILRLSVGAHAASRIDRLKAL
jgi:hypothetical protein